MFKKILIISGYFILVGALAAYFVFSTLLIRHEKSKLVCKSIKVTILDSSLNRFVSEEEILDLIKVQGITKNESKLKHINQYELENILNNKNAVKKSEVSLNIFGELKVDIRQRRPILRLETENGGFYMDDEAYIFPLVRTFTSYVPVVSGNIPLVLMPGHRGLCKKNKEWASSLMEFGLYLDKEPFWNSQIEQIYVDEKQLIHLTPRIGEQDIVFGNLENIEYKFKKLLAFYNSVIPNEGWNKYRQIDVQYGIQIVCKRRDYKNQTDTIAINKNINI